MVPLVRLLFLALAVWLTIGFVDGSLGAAAGADASAFASTEPGEADETFDDRFLEPPEYAVSEHEPHACDAHEPPREIAPLYEAEPATPPPRFGA